MCLALALMRSSRSRGLVAGCLCLVVLACSFLVVFGGYWEVKFYSGGSLEEYWKYSDTFSTLESHSTYYPISDMAQDDIGPTDDCFRIVHSNAHKTQERVNL